MRVYFNRRRQWLDVYIHDVSPVTFERKNGTYWGYYVQAYPRKNRLGLFGEVHLVSKRVTVDTVAHELLHAFIDWMRCKSIVITNSNEERLVSLFDELTRNFWREYKKTVKIRSGKDKSYPV